MKVSETSLPGVSLVHARRFGDARGWFAELYNARSFAEAGLPTSFVQDNHSLSARGVLRGLHYQLQQPQGKLVRVLAGHIYDVAVDVRRGSPHFGRWAGFHLRPLSEAGEPEALWIPEGYAHGFLVLSETAEVLYKTTDYYHPQGERTLRWDDRQVGIAWPLELLDAPPLVSGKDAQGLPLAEAELPIYSGFGTQD